MEPPVRSVLLAGVATVTLAAVLAAAASSVASGFPLAEDPAGASKPGATVAGEPRDLTGLPLDDTSFEGHGPADAAWNPLAVRSAEPEATGLAPSALAETATGTTPTSRHGPVDHPPPPVCGDRVPHPPIVITEDEGPAGFVLGEDPLTGSPIYRPGSGVVAGEGTSDAPYVIAGWCITPVEDSVHILIQNTSAHVEVRDNVLDGRVDPSVGTGVVGLFAENVGNLTIRDNFVARHEYHQIRIQDSPGVAVVDNTIRHDPALRPIRFFPSAGLLVERSPGAVASGNTLVGNEEGIVLDDSPDAEVSGNTIRRTDFAVALRRGGNTDITGNTVTDSDFGVYLDRAPGNRLRDNQLGEGGLFVLDRSRVSFDQDADASNTVAGEPLRYVSGVDGASVPAPAGQVVVGNATDVQVSDLTLEDTTVAVQVGFSEGVTLENVTVRGGYLGANIDDTTDVAVTNSTFRQGQFMGVHGSEAVGTTIENSTFEGMTFGAIMYDALRTNVTGNTFQNGSVGLRLLQTDRTTVKGNAILGNWEGVDVYDASRTELRENSLVGNADAGVSNDGGPTVDARYNWWGCPDGPDDPACDDVEGDVRYDPWLTSSP